MAMRILVPVDGSAPANRAVGYAAALARDKADASLVLINVQSSETLDVSDFTAVISVNADRKAAAARSRKALRRAVAICRQAPVAFETHAALGPIAETIDRLARQLNADQIVMGTRGMGALRRLLVGSVATRVVQLARIPVTLIK
jgi:nucleotide-binding universal stress UspA family protein